MTTLKPCLYFRRLLWSICYVSVLFLKPACLFAWQIPRLKTPSSWNTKTLILPMSYADLLNPFLREKQPKHMNKKLASINLAVMIWASGHSPLICGTDTFFFSPFQTLMAIRTNYGIQFVFDNYYCSWSLPLDMINLPNVIPLRKPTFPLPTLIKFQELIG